jgi:hypothetical protein
VQNLAFVERLDLITWLEGASEESEYIKPLTSSTAGSAQAAAGIAGGVAPTTSGAAGRQSKPTDPRLQEIYSGERSMGDRNSVLRGIKPTVLSIQNLIIMGILLTIVSIGLLPRAQDGYTFHGKKVSTSSCIEHRQQPGARHESKNRNASA